MAAKKKKISTAHWFINMPLVERFSAPAIRIASSYERMKKERSFLTIKEICELFSISRSTYYRRKRALNINSRQMSFDEVRIFKKRGILAEGTYRATAISMHDVERIFRSLSNDPKIKEAAAICSLARHEDYLSERLVLEAMRGASGDIDQGKLNRHISAREERIEDHIEDHGK